MARLERQAHVQQDHDAELVERAQAGDAWAADLLFRRHWLGFVRFAEQRCANPADAMDVCQAALINGFEKLASLRQPSAFRDWILRSICHHARDLQRAEKINGTAMRENTSYIWGEASENVRGSPEDMNFLVGSLRQQAEAMDETHAKVGVFLLESWLLTEEMPTIRAVALGAGISHGTAERALRAVRTAWKHNRAVVELQS